MESWNFPAVRAPYLILNESARKQGLGLSALGGVNGWDTPRAEACRFTELRGLTPGPTLGGPRGNPRRP